MRADMFGLGCVACAMMSATAWGGVEAVAIGDAPRPSSYAGRPLTAFAPDSRPVFTDVSNFVAPGSHRDMFINKPVNLRHAGSTYFGWGRGYTGDVYYTNSELNETLALPPYTTAIVIYASNGGFGTSPTTFTCSDGTSSAQVQGDLNTTAALGFAFYATGGKVLQTININSLVCPLGLGEFMIQCEGTSGCAADLTGDGLVDFSDYLEFLNRFEAQDLMVDFNQDGQIDFSDYLEFLNAFDASC